jgi:hypothetical protein
MNILGQVKTVLWSFIGIGGRKPGERDKVNLVVVIGVAFVLVALLLGTIFFIARHAAGA